MDKLFFFLDHLYTLYDIPICCFYDNESNYIPAKVFQDINPFIHDEKLRAYLIDKWEGQPYLELENDSIVYGFCQNKKGLMCIIGPISLKVLSNSELYQYKSKHGLLSFDHFKIRNGNIKKAAALLSLIHERINNTQISLKRIIGTINLEDVSSKVTEKELFNYQLNNTEYNLNHHPYNMEKVYMSAITNGDLDLLTAAIKPNMIESVGILAKSPYKQMEYMSVSGITLFARAAIEGGANSEEVFNISDLYLQKLALCKDEVELNKIVQSAKFDFCHCVIRAKKRRSGSIYIDQCKDYIARHLNKNFTLEDIANSIGINKCYLTHHFSLKEGKTLKKYIQQERINASKNMLKYSNRPISVIAKYFYFSSQSHFGSVFKKITKKTPAAFRSENKNKGFTNNKSN